MNLRSTRIDTRDVHSGRPLCIGQDCSVRWSSGDLWGDFLAEYHDIASFDSPEFCFAAHSIIVHPGPRVMVDQKICGEDKQYALGAGDVEIFPARMPIQVRHGRKDLIVLAISPSLFARVAEDAAGAPVPSLRAHPRLRDREIEQIAELLVEEALTGFAHGRLYGESLGTALAAHLVSRYCETQPRRISVGGMAPRCLQRVLDYVDANLCRDVSLGALAEVAGLSTHRFAHNFKRAMGVAPHQHVIRERVERAKRMLRETNLTVAAVGYATGFNSPSRFALLFRRTTGTTPSAFRERVRDRGHR